MWRCGPTDHIYRPIYYPPSGQLRPSCGSPLRRPLSTWHQTSVSVPFACQGYISALLEAKPQGTGACRPHCWNPGASEPILSSVLVPRSHVPQHLESFRWATPACGACSWRHRDSTGWLRSWSHSHNSPAPPPHMPPRVRHGVRSTVKPALAVVPPQASECSSQSCCCQARPPA